MGRVGLMPLFLFVFLSISDGLAPVYPPPFVIPPFFIDARHKPVIVRSFRCVPQLSSPAHFPLLCRFFVGVHSPFQAQIVIERSRASSPGALDGASAVQATAAWLMWPSSRTWSTREIVQFHDCPIG